MHDVKLKVAFPEFESLKSHSGRTVTKSTITVRRTPTEYKFSTYLDAVIIFANRN